MISARRSDEGWISRPWKHSVEAHEGLPVAGGAGGGRAVYGEGSAGSEMLAQLQKLRRSQAMKQNNEDARGASITRQIRK